MLFPVLCRQQPAERSTAARVLGLSLNMGGVAESGAPGSRGSMGPDGKDVGQNDAVKATTVRGGAPEGPLTGKRSASQPSSVQAEVGWLRFPSPAD